MVGMSIVIERLTSKTLQIKRELKDVRSMMDNLTDDMVAQSPNEKISLQDKMQMV